MALSFAPTSQPTSRPISEDELTWTFPLKQGVMYSPPFEDVEVTAQDFVRAIEREADPKASSGGYSFYYSAIEGFDDFGAGDADEISGIRAVDDYTLEVTVTEPTGDLGWRFAMSATTPIPPNGDARLGAAEGHTKDYGRFLVSTGPYMFEGSEDMDFSLPADKQEPVAGYTPGRSIVLVRNPSWSAETDDLRPAYADEITIEIGGEVSDLYNKLESGDLDYVMDPPEADVLKTYSTDPELSERLHVYPQPATSYTSMNLGVPPFDDVQVRKAVNFAYDKAGGRQLAGGPLVGVNAGHIFPDALLNNVLVDYDPYASPEDHGDIEKAKTEMSTSKYDSDGDGVCDDPECEGVAAIYRLRQRDRPQGRRPVAAVTRRDRHLARHQGPVDHRHVRQVQQPCRAGADLPAGRMAAGLPRRLHLRPAAVRRKRFRCSVPRLLQLLGRGRDRSRDAGVGLLGDRCAECR